MMTPARALLTRPRLDVLLRGSVSAYAITLVQAPLGAGKTTALQMALGAQAGLAWIDTKPWHRGAMPRSLIETVRRQRPDFGRLTLGAIEADADPTHVGMRFAQDLTHVGDPLVLVIDDAQILDADRDFTRFFTIVAGSLPAPVRVVVCGRSLPELGWGEVFGRGHAAAIDADAFAFDRDDVTQLARLYGRALEPADAAQIVAGTNGWATGVALSLAAAQPAFGAPWTEPHAACAAYIAEQLLPALAPDLMAFLEDVAVFETLDLRVLERSDAFVNARESIAGLRRSGALMSQLPSGHYRVHPILRTLVADRLAARGGTVAAQRVAAFAYAGAGELIPALFHARAAGDPTTAAVFLRRYASAATATGDGKSVRAVAALIDPAGPDRDVRWYVDALLGKARGDGQIRAMFATAADAARHGADRAILFDARAQMIEYDLGRLNRVDAAAIAELTADAVSLDPTAAARAATLHGWSLAVEADFLTARARVAPLAGLGDADARFNIGILLAYVQTALGECDSAQETLETLLRSFENDDRVVFQTLTLIWLARLGLLWGETNVAADAAHQARRLTRAMDLHANEAALYVALAEVATHFGECDAIAAFAELARRRAPQAWYVADIERVRAFADVALARLAFLRNDYATARDVAVRAAAAPSIPSAQRAVLAAEAAIYTLLVAPQAAAVAIADARAAISSAAAIDASDAIAIATASDLIAFLDAADDRARPSGLPMCAPFAALIERRRGLVTLEVAGLAVGSARRGSGSAASFEATLANVTAAGPRFEVTLARAYAGRFIPAARSAPRHDAVAFDLTPREIEILDLLVDGLTNKEIAQRLSVSPRTVESHVERVLGKLAVGSRSRAIAKAIRLGLVNLDRPA